MTTRVVKQRRDVTEDMGQIKYCQYVIERTAGKSTFFKNILPFQDYGLFRRETTVDMNASDEPAASIFVIGAPKESALSLKF